MQTKKTNKEEVSKCCKKVSITKDIRSIGLCIEGKFCSACNKPFEVDSTVKKTNKEEVRYKENINCENAIVEIDSTPKPKKEYCDCLTLLDHYNNKCNDKFPPPNHPAFNSTPKPSVKESWKKEFNKRFVVHCSDGDILDGMVSAKVVERFITSELETARKEHNLDCTREEWAMAKARKETLEEVKGMIENKFYGANDVKTKDILLELSKLK